MTIGLQVPALTTQRLTLAPLSFAHSPSMFALWSDPQVCRFSGEVCDYDRHPLPMPAASRSISDAIIDFWLRAAADGWGFRWAVATAEQECVGTVGFNSVGTCAEVAYHLHPSQWGRGLMHEACEAALAWQVDQGSKAIEAYIHIDNRASITLAHRLGLTALGASCDDNTQRYYRTFT